MQISLTEIQIHVFDFEIQTLQIYRIQLVFRRFVLILVLCYFVLVFFSPLTLQLPRLGKRELISVFFVLLFHLRLFILYFIFLLFFLFVLFLFFSSSWCLGRAAACDCTFL